MSGETGGLTAEEREALNRAQFLTPNTLEDNPVHQVVERIVASRDARLAAVEALADEWAALGDNDSAFWWSTLAMHVRAALRPVPDDPTTLGHERGDAPASPEMKGSAP